MLPTTFTNAFAAFGSCTLGYQTSSGSGIYPALTWNIYNAKPGTTNVEGPSIDGLGAAFVTWKAGLPTGTPAVIVINGLNRMLGPADEPSVNSPYQPTLTEVYNRCAAEFTSVQSTGCDLFLMDTEWAPGPTALSHFNSSIGQAITDRLNNTKISDYLHAPRDTATLATYEPNRIGQISCYGDHYDPADTSTFSRAKTAAIFFLHQFGFAPNKQCLAYIAPQSVDGVIAFDLPGLRDYYKLNNILSLGVTLYFDYGDTGDVGKAQYAAMHNEYVAVAGTSPISRLTNIVVESDRVYAVAQQANGNFVACQIDQGTRVLPAVVDTGVGGKMLIPPPPTGYKATFGAATNQNLPRYLSFASRSSLTARYGMSDYGDVATESVANLHGSYPDVGVTFRGKTSLIPNAPQEKGIDFVSGYPSATLNTSTALCPPQCTVMFWTNPGTGGSGTPTAFSSCGGYNRGIWVRETAPNSGIFNTYIYSNGGFRGPAVSTVPVGQTSHFVFTHDGTTMRTYVNGVPSGTYAYTGQITSAVGAASVGSTPTDGNTYSGTIQDVRVYNEVWTATDIAKLYVLGATAYIPPPADVRSTQDRGDGLPGKLVVPSASDVRSGTVFDNGTTGTMSTGGGSVTLPPTSAVRNGVTYNNGSSTGTLVVPAASDVKSGTTFDNGTSGTLVVPTAANVRSGFATGTATGTLVVPNAADVRLGIVFDNGTTGTLTVGSGSGNAGPGATATILTVEGNGAPVQDFECWVTSDAAGLIPVSGVRGTNSAGQVTFNLDTGSTYYLRGHGKGFQLGGTTAIPALAFVA